LTGDWPGCLNCGQRKFNNACFVEKRVFDRLSGSASLFPLDLFLSVFADLAGNQFAGNAISRGRLTWTSHYFHPTSLHSQPPCSTQQTSRTDADLVCGRPASGWKHYPMFRSHCFWLLLLRLIFNKHPQKKKCWWAGINPRANEKTYLFIEIKPQRRTFWSSERFKG